MRADIDAMARTRMDANVGALVAALAGCDRIFRTAMPIAYCR